MSKLPSITPKKLLKKFQRLGFIEDHKTGSHIIMFNPNTKRRAVIPYHLKDLPRGTFSAILRESGISREEFLKK